MATDISGRHETFRATHAQVKEFVRFHKLKAGDIVEIIRVAPWDYRVRPAQAKQDEGYVGINRTGRSASKR